MLHGSTHMLDKLRGFRQASSCPFRSLKKVCGQAKVTQLIFQDAPRIGVWLIVPKPITYRPSTMHPNISYLIITSTLAQKDMHATKRCTSGLFPNFMGRFTHTSYGILSGIEQSSLSLFWISHQGLSRPNTTFCEDVKGPQEVVTYEREPHFPMSPRTFGKFPMHMVSSKDRRATPTQVGKLTGELIQPRLVGLRVKGMAVSLMMQGLQI